LPTEEAYVSVVRLITSYAHVGGKVERRKRRRWEDQERKT